MLRPSCKFKILQRNCIMAIFICYVYFNTALSSYNVTICMHVLHRPGFSSPFILYWLITWWKRFPYAFNVCQRICQGFFLCVGVSLNVKAAYLKIIFFSIHIHTFCQRFPKEWFRFKKYIRKNKKRYAHLYMSVLLYSLLGHPDTNLSHTSSFRLP